MQKLDANSSVARLSRCFRSPLGEPNRQKVVKWDWALPCWQLKLPKRQAGRDVPQLGGLDSCGEHPATRQPKRNQRCKWAGGLWAFLQWVSEPSVMVLQKSKGSSADAKVGLGICLCSAAHCVHTSRFFQPLKMQTERPAFSVSQLCCLYLSLAQWGVHLCTLLNNNLEAHTW